MSNTGYETPALIATAISNGDQQAAVVLYTRYYKGTLFLLERKTGDAELARDLCHEAFCVLLERLRTKPLEYPEKLIAFLHNIAINLHIAEYRKSIRRNTVVDQSVIDVAADKQYSQYRQLLQERKGIAVRKVIADLTNTRDKELLYGYYILEKDKAEICTELKLSLRHFDKVLFRAKQRFKQAILENQGPAGVTEKA